MHHTAQLERFWGNVGNEEEKIFKSSHSRAKNVMQFNFLKQIVCSKGMKCQKNSGLQNYCLHKIIIQIGTYIACTESRIWIVAFKRSYFAKT